MRLVLDLEGEEAETVRQSLERIRNDREREWCGVYSSEGDEGDLFPPAVYAMDDGGGFLVAELASEEDAELVAVLRNALARMAKLDTAWTD